MVSPPGVVRSDTVVTSVLVRWCHLQVLLDQIRLLQQYWSRYSVGQIRCYLQVLLDVRYGCYNSTGHGIEWSDGVTSRCC